ncbi:MAG: hypothetical protein IJ789_01810 [Bacteroidales bacterium]|nr:hypothetical protein [Bacteroidales bacterium]
MEFARNEGFPVDENGQTVNDRDYERDQEAQRITRDMADRYDSRAIQSVPVVSKDGVVLSGNGRTMAGELAAKQGTDGAYIEHLKKYPQQFGFTPEQVGAMEHPRVVFVPDEEMPYTTESFAKFNAQDMKSQSRTEQAVKLGKTVDDDTFGRIVRSINGFDSLADFYSDPKAASTAIGELYKAGAINQMQLAEMMDGEKVSGAGRQMLENMLIGKAFESNPDAVRQLAEYPAMRQSVVAALAEVANNLKLGEEYSLEGELAQAIDLAYQARKSGTGAGEKVSPFARQQSLFPFETGETVADYTNATVLMLADLINDSRVNQLKKTLALYNDNAATSAAGQMDIFSGGVKSKEEIIKDVLNTLNYGTENEKREAHAGATERRKEAAGVSEDGADAAGVSEDGADAAGGNARDGQNNMAQTQVTAQISSEVNEFGIPFVLASDGTTTFGEVSADSGLTEAPIKLSVGENYVDENGNHGYGVLHIEAGHGDQIRAAGFSSVEEFVETVAKNYDTIREGGVIASNQTYLLEISDEHNNTLFIQLSRDGKYWNVNSAGIFKKKYSRSKPEVYTRPAVESGTGTDSSEVNRGQTEGATATSRNSSQLSGGKVTNNSGTDQINNVTASISAAEAEAKTEPMGGQNSRSGQSGEEREFEYTTEEAYEEYVDALNLLEKLPLEDRIAELRQHRDELARRKAAAGKKSAQYKELQERLKELDKKIAEVDERIDEVEGKVTEAAKKRVKYLKEHGMLETLDEEGTSSGAAAEEGEKPEGAEYTAPQRAEDEDIISYAQRVSDSYEAHMEEKKRMVETVSASERLAEAIERGDAKAIEYALAKAESALEQRGSAAELTEEETAMRDGLVEAMRGAGIEVETDEAVGQRVLDEVNGESDAMSRGKRTENQRKRDESNGNIDEALALATGKSVGEARKERVDREEKRREAAKEVYEIILSGEYNYVTLQKISDYIDDVTPRNPYERRLSERLPQRVERALYERERSSAIDALFSRASESAVAANERVGSAGRRAVEAKKKELIEKWAKATGNWHTDLRDFTDNTEAVSEGTADSDVYLSNDGKHVIKLSRGKQEKRFGTDIDAVTLFNYVFPNSAYRLLGYGDFGKGFVKVLEQPYVDFASSTPLTEAECVEYMAGIGFRPINKENTAFSNGEIVVADLQGSNIVRDASGNIRVIDADCKLHTKDVGGEYSYPPVEHDMPRDRVREQRVYHGSGADFDAFDHSYMGTGEGLQVYGWGSYVTEVEGIGRTYAEQTFVSPAMRDKLYEFHQKNIEYQRKANEFSKAVGPKESQLKDELDRLSEECYRLWDEYKEMEAERGRYLYTVEIPDDADAKRLTIKEIVQRAENPEAKLGHYLSWDEEVPEKEKMRIKSALTKAVMEKMADATPSDRTDERRSISAEFRLDVSSGAGVYNTMAKHLSPKEASELLHDLGYVGIKYPAEYQSGGREDGAKDYVIFDEKDLKITDKLKFFKTADGQAYGYTYKGKVYIDPKIATAETPVHEYTHLWAEALRRANPEAWKRLKGELAQDEELTAWVKGKYPELEGDELMEEVFAHYSGRRGRERLMDEMRSEMEREPDMTAKARVASVLHRLKALLDRFWQTARDLFAGNSAKLDEMSAEDFADMALADLLHGENPTAEMAKRRADRHKAAQLREVVGKNPMEDSYHRGIRSIDDIKTMDEAVKEREREMDGDDMLSAYPDVSDEMLRVAQESGRITVYSSKPIENGVFVTPSRMQAEEYAGGGRVYSAEVETRNVAWLDVDEGQMARVEREEEWVKFHDGEDDVYTSSFKNWFGDWEKAAEQVTIVGAEKVHGFANFNDARRWAKENIVGEYENPEIGSVNISGTAIDKYLSEKAVNKSDNKDVHLSALKVMPSIIENSIVGEVYANKKGSQGIRDIVRLYGAIDTDGKVYRVKTTVKRYNNENEKTKAYSYEVTEIELLEGTHGDDVRNPLPRSGNNSISATKLLKNVESVGKNILDSSKIVDEESGEDEGVRFRMVEDDELVERLESADAVTYDERGM